MTQLIRLGANLNAQDNDGWTPLMTAASTVSETKPSCFALRRLLTLVDI